MSTRPSGAPAAVYEGLEIVWQAVLNDVINPGTSRPLAATFVATRRDVCPDLNAPREELLSLCVMSPFRHNALKPFAESFFAISIVSAFVRQKMRPWSDFPTKAH